MTIRCFVLAATLCWVAGCTTTPPLVSTPATSQSQLLPLADQRIAANPQSAEAWARRGHLHLEEGRVDAARADLTQALQLDPKHSAALLDRATLRHTAGDAMGAMADINTAHSAQPDNARIQGMRCVIRVSAERSDAGLTDCHAALKLAGPPANAQVSLGQALLILKRHPEALVAFESALRAQPTHARALYGRGIARQQLGDPRGADDVSEALRRLPGAGREFTSAVKSA